MGNNLKNQHYKNMGIKHIYDTHFEGAEDVEKMAALWDSLEGCVKDCGSVIPL